MNGNEVADPRHSHIHPQLTVADFAQSGYTDIGNDYTLFYRRFLQYRVAWLGRTPVSPDF